MNFIDKQRNFIDKLGLGRAKYKRGERRTIIIIMSYVKQTKQTKKLHKKSTICGAINTLSCHVMLNVSIGIMSFRLIMAYLITSILVRSKYLACFKTDMSAAIEF